MRLSTKMRLWLLLGAAILAGAPVLAQDGRTSPAAVSRTDDPLAVPVSLDHIREELARPAPLTHTLWLNPDFQIGRAHV